MLMIACLFVVNVGTANALLISPDDPPMVISEPTIDFYSAYTTNYDPALAWAFENDVLTGDGATGSLREDDCVKRAELLKMLYNVLVIDTANPQAELFSDTFSDQWYADYIRKARERSTIAGYPDGTFRPSQCVNRAEAVKMALLEFPNVNPVSTSINVVDVPESEWYYQYVSYALANNLVGLKHTTYYDGSKYYPGDSMSRAEFAEMLYRLKTLQDNNLASYDVDYSPENIDKMALQNYDLEPEEFFESQTSLLITLNTQNQTQVSALDGFLRNTPAGSTDDFIETLLESISDEIAPAFDDGTKVMFAAGESSNSAQLESLLFTVNNGPKLEAAFESLSKQSGFSKSTLFGFKTFDNRNDGTFYAYTDNVMATWPAPGDRYLALQKIKNGESNLLDNSEYTTFASSIPSSNIGTVYFNARGNESGILAVVPNTSGIKLYYRVNGLEFNSGASNAPHMYKNLPGNDLLMYGEADSMIDSLGEQGMDIISELQQEGMLVSPGDWLNQGYAFVMQDTGTLIPGLSLYFDAAGFIDQAKEDLEILDSFLDVVLAQMDADEPELADVIVKDTVSVDGATLNRVSIDVTALPQEELQDLEMFEGLLGDSLEFYYGLTSDNYVVFALYSGFDDVYGSVPTVSSNPDVKAGLSYLTGYPNGLSYISLENMLTYVDMLILEFENVSGEPMPAEMKESYNQVMDYLDPVKYIISAEKDFSGLPGGLMFVKIN